jgi:hypothetical protein
MQKILPWNGRTHFKNRLLRTANSLESFQKLGTRGSVILKIIKGPKLEVSFEF